MDYLKRLVEIEELKIPIGIKTIVTTVADTTCEIKLDPPWISFNLYNGSRSYGLSYSVNSEEGLQDLVYLDAGQSVTLDSRLPLIKVIYLRAEPDGSCPIELIGIQGKKYE